MFLWASEVRRLMYINNILINVTNLRSVEVDVSRFSHLRELLVLPTCFCVVFRVVQNHNFCKANLEWGIRQGLHFYCSGYNSCKASTVHNNSLSFQVCPESVHMVCLSLSCAEKSYWVVQIQT